MKARRSGTKDTDQMDIIEKNESLVTQQKDLEEKEEEVQRLLKEMLEYKTKFEELFEENDELRKGMKQILEDVREQDGQSDVLIQCPSLEKLVGILDARHLWGNYHPAMGLKAQIDKLDGQNIELRGQLRKARLEEDKLINQLQRFKAKTTSMEKELSEMKDAQMVQGQVPTGSNKDGLRIALPSIMPGQSIASTPSSTIGINASSSSELVSKVNLQLIQVLNQLEAKEEHCKNLKEGLTSQQTKISVLRHQMGLVYEQFYQERKQKDKSIEQMNQKANSLQENLEAMKAKVQVIKSVK